MCIYLRCKLHARCLPGLSQIYCNNILFYLHNCEAYVWIFDMYKNFDLWEMQEAPADFVSLTLIYTLFNLLLKINLRIFGIDNRCDEWIIEVALSNWISFTLINDFIKMNISAMIFGINNSSDVWVMQVALSD